MSIVICEVCEERIDMDYDEVYDTGDYKMICIPCYEEMSEMEENDE